jgi:biotin carboxyl carrier protein
MKISVKIDDELFEVEVGDLDARPVLATVAGQTFEVWPEAVDQPHTAARPALALEGQPPVPPAGLPRPEPLSRDLPSAPETALAPARPVLAPIPGVILSVGVQPGQSVAFGQELCVLEAMKMKNAIRAPRPGRISAVSVQPGDQVRHGQILIEYAS